MNNNCIKLSIQEIVSDFYKLAEEEGFLSGLAEIGLANDNDLNHYHSIMLELIEKYIPDWKKSVDKKYFSANTYDEKGIILSIMLYNNFKEIFYGLI